MPQTCKVHVHGHRSWQPSDLVGFCRDAAAKRFSCEAWIRDLKVLPYLLGAWLVLVGLQTMRTLAAVIVDPFMISPCRFLLAARTSHASVALQAHQGPCRVLTQVMMTTKVRLIDASIGGAWCSHACASCSAIRFRCWQF